MTQRPRAQSSSCKDTEGTNYGPESMHTIKIKNLVPKFGFYSLINSKNLLIISYLVYGVLLQKLKQTKAIVK